MVLNASPNETYMFRTDTLRFTYVNRSGLDNLGYTLEAMQALTPIDIESEATEASFREFINPLLTGEQAELTFQTVHQRKNGSSYSGELHLQVVGQGEERTFLAFIHDITAREQQEHCQATQYAITRLLLESSTLEEAAPYILRMICQTLGWDVGVMWRVDEEMQVLRCAEVWDEKSDCRQFIERTRQSNFAIGIGLPGRVWKSRRVEWITDVTCDDNFPRALSAANAGLHAAFAFPIRSRDQLYGIMEFFAIELREPDQKLLDMFEGIAGQISQFLNRKQAEQALRISEARVAGILDIAEEAIVSVDEAHRIMQFNQGASKVFGYAPSEVLGQSIDMLLPSRFVQAHDRKIGEFGASSTSSRGMGSRREVAGRRKNGEEFPAEASITKVCVNGETTFTVILRDITERKEAEQRLQNAKSQAEQAARERAEILATVEAFFICVNGQGAVTTWTPRAETIFSISLGEALGRSFTELPIQWSWKEVIVAMEKAGDTINPIRVDKIRLTHQNGEEVFLKLTVSPICDDRGVTYVLMGEDISDRLVLEHELVEAQKLESIGHLAAGIAHEINTPTQFVGDNVRFLSDSFSDIGRLLEQYQRLLEAAKTGVCPEALIETCEAANRGADLEYLLAEIPKAIEQSMEGIDRVATIVRAMKEFAHPGSKEKAAVNLNKAIESTVTVARNEWKYVADLHTNLDPSLPSVPCLVGEFNQVVLNMIINASHAIADAVKGTGGKGTITICTSRVGDFVEVRIADTGMGIPESIRHKIFDPFFTTKEVGQGTGQGLAIARSVIVSKHGGTIAVDSEVGKGTTFLIRLPLNASPANSVKEGVS
ncbi:MAG: PAS domain S-box protein [Nitrospiraceae bacterium]